MEAVCGCAYNARNLSIRLFIWTIVNIHESLNTYALLFTDFFYGHCCCSHCSLSTLSNVASNNSATANNNVEQEEWIEWAHGIISSYGCDYVWVRIVSISGVEWAGKRPSWCAWMDIFGIWWYPLDAKLYICGNIAAYLWWHYRGAVQNKYWRLFGCCIKAHSWRIKSLLQSK